MQVAVCEAGCQHIGDQCCSPSDAYMTLFSLALLMMKLEDHEM